MKRIIYTILFALSLSLTSCSFLDIDPENGLDETQVFSTWDNYWAYFSSVYTGKESDENVNLKLTYPMYIDFNDRRFTWNSLTDMSDTGRLIRAQQIKAGALGENAQEWTTTLSRRPISYAMFRLIRICNKSIENVEMLQNGKQADIDDMLGQAYFVRALCHFTLCRVFGGMPYIDHVLEADDNWDMTRLTANETYRKCAEDFDMAFEYFLKAGKVRRDPVEGSSGHLDVSDMNLPNGAAAKAFKARCLLYAASELNNLNGTKDWEDAALACAEAIDVAEYCGYDLLPFSEWSLNFYGTKYTNEHLWAYNYGSGKINTSTFSAMFAFPVSNYSNASGDCPTQNFVDRFETKYGDPLMTEEERAEAIAQGHYNDQNPYADRDPRFDKTILHDGSVVAGCATGINIHYDPVKKTWPTTTLNSSARTFGISWGSNDSKGYTNTGYYVNKHWNGNLGTAAAYQHTEPQIRMAEVYLNYAEAVNEAYGPNGKAGDCSLTAVDALNKIRRRANMPDVLAKFTGSTDAFRERIRNERCVEFAFEAHHYYHDIRRWKIAPKTMTQTLMGMYIEKVDVSEEYPVGRRYERRAIPANRQSTWKDAMYYFPFPTEEANKMKNFVNNEVW